MAKKEDLENLTLAAKKAQKSGANRNEIDKAVRLDWPLDPIVESLRKKPKPGDPEPGDRDNPLSGFRS
jgi:hypothetical protein